MNKMKIEEENTYTRHIFGNICCSILWVRVGYFMYSKFTLVLFNGCSLVQLKSKWKNVKYECQIFT